MDTFMCLQRCGALCSTKIPAFILKRLTYPSGLTKSDKELIGKHPKDALWVSLFQDQRRASHSPDIWN